MKIQKITPGYVVQIFDTDTKRYVSQEFVAGSDVDYDNMQGEPVDPMEVEMQEDDGTEPYLPFNMVQPTEPGTHVFNTETGRCLRCNCDEDDAFVGGQECVQ